MIIIDVDGNSSSFVLRYSPEKNWIESGYLEDGMPAFTGELSLLSLQGEVIATSDYENGQYVSLEANVAGRISSGCETVFKVEYWYTCIGETCTYTEITITEYEVCPDSGGGDFPVIEEETGEETGGETTIGVLEPECLKGVLDENGVCRQEETDLDKIMQCEELSDFQLNKLKGVVQDYLSDCLNLQIFDYLVEGEKKVCFKIGSNSGEPGSYNHLNSTISFANSSAINASVFGEEIFHTYQDVYYGGLSQFSSVGRSNIEFEAKLFHDLVNGEFQCCMVFSNSAVFTEYFIWLTQITNDFSSLPSWNDISEKYFYYLEEFKKDKLDYDYPTDYSLLPGALLNLENC